MIDRNEIYDELKKHGLKRSGMDFISEDGALKINTAILISCIRRNAETLSLEKAVESCIDKIKTTFPKPF